MKRRNVLVMASVMGATLSTHAYASGCDGRPKKIAIVYFSRDGLNYWKDGTKDLPKGNTARLAEIIRERTGGELFRIEADRNYPKDYKEMTEVAKKELQEEARPPIKGEIPNLKRYDVIFFGHPVWWGHMPMVMRTFLDTVPLEGKTVVHFVTHEGSGLGESDADLQKRVKKAQFLKPLAVSGTEVDDSYQKVANWVKDLDL